MKGLLYAWESIIVSEKNLTKKELNYIDLQQELKEIDNADNINQVK